MASPAPRSSRSWLQVIGPRTDPPVAASRGVTTTLPRNAMGRLMAPLTRFAVTPNARIGGIQLPSIANPPGSVNDARGRGTTGARLVLSVLENPAERWASLNGGRYDSSSPSEP